MPEHVSDSLPLDCATRGCAKVNSKVTRLAGL